MINVADNVRASQPSMPDNQGLASEIEWYKSNIPCQTACPAHTDVSNYVGLVAEGRFDEAYLLNRRDNVFPGILGRICARPCEGSCRRGLVDDAIRICWLKRSSSDFRSGKFLPKRAKITRRQTVAIVGAGPSGLTAARDLTLKGYKCVVFDALPEIGGMMVAGIPEWRLPRDVVKNEVDEYFAALGVEVRLNTRIGVDITLQQLMRQYDSVLLACGQQSPKRPGIPGEHLQGVEFGLNWLEKYNLQSWRNPAALEAVAGKRVVVLGAGFTAMDCSRTAIRLGASEVQVLYRRTQAEAAIDNEEVGEASQEKIFFQWLVSPVEIVSYDDVHVSGIKMVRNQLSAPDAKGERYPVALPGSEFVIPCDMVIAATGQSSDVSWLPPEMNVRVRTDGRMLIDHQTWMTSVRGLFGAGDFTEGSRNIISAVADGHKVANSIHTFLSGERPEPTYSELEIIDDWDRDQDYLTIKRQEMPKLSPKKRLSVNRIKSLQTEVELGYSAQMAMREATRCLQCAYNIDINPDLCILCGACVEVCPEKVLCIVPVQQLATATAPVVARFGEVEAANNGAKMLSLDEDKCVRCGLCVTSCPTEAIKMTRFCHSEPTNHWFVSELVPKG